MPSRVPFCLPHIFPGTMSFSAFTSGARHCLVEEIDACIHQDHQALMHSDPDCDSFSLIMRYCFTLCKELVSPKSYLRIYKKSVARLTGIVARLTATTAILSQVCQQVWSGHWGYADRMCTHPSWCKQTRSVHPDVLTVTFGTCKQVLPNRHTWAHVSMLPVDRITSSVSMYN